jgi:hypothetical protein
MTNVIFFKNGFIKWNMKSNQTCSQIGQNMNIANKKGHKCSQMEHVVITFENEYYINICRLCVGPKQVGR